MPDVPSRDEHNDLLSKVELNEVDIAALNDRLSLLEGPVDPPPPGPEPIPAEPADNIDGFTDYTIQAGSKYIYLRPDGDDTADGLTESNGVRTFSRARSLLVPGDIMMVRRSGEWRGEEIMAGDNWVNDIVVRAYGPLDEPRPLLPGCFIACNNPGVSNVAFQSLDFTQTHRDPTTYAVPDPGGATQPFSCLGGGIVGFRMEDVRFQFCESGPAAMAASGSADWTFHRCQFVHAYKLDDEAGGGFFHGIDGIEFSECVIHGNGWHPLVQDRNDLAPALRVQGMYVHCENTIFRGCITSYNCNFGIKARSDHEGAVGLIIDNCISYADGNGYSIDGEDPAGVRPQFRFVSPRVSRCTFSQLGFSPPPGANQAIGIYLGNVEDFQSSGLLFVDRQMMDTWETSALIQLSEDNYRDIFIHDTIAHRYATYTHDEFGDPKVPRMDFQGHDAAVTDFHDERDDADYVDASQSVTDLQINWARENRMGAWDDNVTAPAINERLRAGFTLVV